MPIVEWDHYTVRSRGAAASCAFYEQALGLNVYRREGFAVPAFIVSIGEREVVHVFQASAEIEGIFARLSRRNDWRGGTPVDCTISSSGQSTSRPCVRVSLRMESRSTNGHCLTSIDCH